MEVLEIELKDYESFRKVMGGMKGKHVDNKKFLDNPSGKCSRCDTFPSAVEETFLALKLIIPNCHKVDLELLVRNFFEEQDNEMRMKCSTCCKCSPVCSHTGFCNRPAVSQYSLVQAPTFLFIQLLRFTNGHQGHKVATLVETKHEFRLQGTTDYRCTRS